MLPGMWLSPLTLLLLLAFPTLSLVHGSAPGVTLHILAGLGLIILIHDALDPYRRTAVIRYWKEYRLLCVTMALPLCLNIVSMLASITPDEAGAGAVAVLVPPTLAKAFSTTVQRLALAGFVLFALFRLRPGNGPAFFQCGIVLASFAASAILYIASEGGDVRPTVEAQNLLNYTNFIALLGVFSLYLLAWRVSPYPIPEAVIKLAAFLSTFYGVLLSDSRGPLLTMAVLLLIYVFFGARQIAVRWRIASAGVLLLVLGTAVLQSEQLMSRFEQAVQATISSVPAMLDGAPPEGGDASTRIRFGLWQAAWQMTKQHPWIGDGSRSFSEKLVDLNAAGLVSDETTWKAPGAAFAQPHNEIANAAATRGIAGVVVVLLLYSVPLYYFVRRRKHREAHARIAADMGIVTCIGVIFFGFTVSVFTSTWMVALYVVLISVLLMLCQSENDTGTTGQAPRAEPGLALKRVPPSGLPTVPGPLTQKILKELYRFVGGRRSRHNVHLWPYARISRDDSGRLCGMRVFKREVPLISISEAFANASPDFHIILSGPSVLDIDYSTLPRFQALGVNGSIALQDRYDIDFPFYCIVDRSFARTQRDTIKRIVSEDRVFLLGPDVLRYILEYLPVEQIRCRFCIIEDLSERAFEPRMTAARLERMQKTGRDIVVFDDTAMLGFSFDPALGWFDADTVAYSALQAVVWGGARQVYFHGLDIQGAETTRRFYEGDGPRLMTRLEQNFQTYIEPSFKGASALLRSRGIQVYNLSPISALATDVMPFLDWRDLSRRSG